MVEIQAISGDPECIAQQLSSLIEAGWEIMDLSTNLYDSSGGIRKETTVFLRNTIQS